MMCKLWRFVDHRPNMHYTMQHKMICKCSNKWWSLPCSHHQTWHGMHQMKPTTQSCVQRIAFLQPHHHLYTTLSILEWIGMWKCKQPLLYFYTYQKKALMNHYFDSLFLHATFATIKEYWYLLRSNAVHRITPSTRNVTSERVLLLTYCSPK